MFRIVPVLVLLLAGCSFDVDSLRGDAMIGEDTMWSGPDGGIPDSMMLDSSIPDSAMDSSVPDASDDTSHPDSGSCEVGETFCAIAECTNTNNDFNNCGRCENSCPPATSDMCQGSLCSCGGGAPCTGENIRCVMGSCVDITEPDCSDTPGTVWCEDAMACVDLQNDDFNCGTCGNRCILWGSNMCLEGECSCSGGPVCETPIACNPDGCGNP